MVKIAIANSFGRMSGKALLLYLSGSDAPFADGRTALTLTLFCHLLEGNGDNLYLKVDAVEDFIPPFPFEGL